MVRQSELLSNADQIRQLAEALRKAPVIAFDTEFIRETTFFPKVEIIQIATETDSWLVDAAAFFDRKAVSRGNASSIEALRPLLDVFEDQSILKVAHAVQGDQECLCTSFGVVATPCVDTAIAASLCGYGDGIGLGNLLKAVSNITIGKGHARTNWSVRPLPSQLLEYAYLDVEYLVVTWKKLEAKLEKLGRRDWALELSAKLEDKSLYESDPLVMVERLAKSGRFDKRSYAALVELMRWREERVRQLNLPRRWVADDNVLIDLARVRPKDLDHLGTFRGLNKGELKNSGEAILTALRRASESQDIKPPHLPRLDAPSGAESQVLDLLKCYVGILADQHQIASKHLLTSSQLLPLLRSNAVTENDLVEQGILSVGAARLIGEEVVAILQGRRAFSIEQGQVKVVELNPPKER